MSVKNAKRDILNRVSKIIDNTEHATEMDIDIRYRYDEVTQITYQVSEQVIPNDEKITITTNTIPKGYVPPSTTNPVLTVPCYSISEELC